MSKLRKSTTDKMVFGVCGGIAEYFGWDPTLVRVIFIVLTFAGIGSPILIYLILALIIPN
jgi:phage shock protein PspC (stress-responsive transcriptional regulator)